MNRSAQDAVPEIERATETVREAHQTERLTAVLRTVAGRNVFYTRKWATHGVDISDVLAACERDGLAALERIPFTTKDELVADQAAAPPWGTALTEPLQRYTRYHQTSSTTGRPLRWLDTPESWQWGLDCWKAVYRAAGVTPADRIVFAFSFGPFYGFWTAFEAAAQIGAHCVPTGGMTSLARIALIETLRPTVLCCTPTYALRLAEVAQEQRAGETPLAGSAVRTVIVAGEPGGSIPATRRLIEAQWAARVIDHHGLTEAGPISFECVDGPGFVHLNDAEFVCEVRDRVTGQPVPDGEPGELVVTNLGRRSSPVIRYKTGDIVARETEACRCGRTLTRLRGGVLARADDMVVVKGVNVYPSAVEAAVRAVPDVVEYRATVRSTGTLKALGVEIEVAASSTAGVDMVLQRVRESLASVIGLTVPVVAVDSHTLPRFDMKARRFIVAP